MEEDRNAILSLPVGISRVEDTLMWHYEQCGTYSVKSGYWLGCAMADLPRTLGLNCTDSWWKDSWWKYLWRLPMALKIKMFIWIACYDWVPTRCNLVGRGMTMTSKCPMCNQSLETTLHAVWGCKIFKDVRKSCNFGMPMGKGKNMKFFDFIMSCLEKMKGEELELLHVVLWRNWCHRNLVTHGSNGVCLGDTMDYRGNICLTFGMLMPILRRAESEQLGATKWVLPTSGLLKLNTDAALDASSGVEGVGLVVRGLHRLCVGYELTTSCCNL
ncbi:hypothetical protein Ddye_011472 [Dipteronia dyeriana]|uniref:Reverse transcriptase zinc-binding domain-containing protein n=1 Tax=Dipteronia dyeriana TaxID=168575 RepID=A0AAD9X2J7_9ROSI|nr:hypothetical protein Ddye_011472 [Dipteronia dyeriana]